LDGPGQQTADNIVRDISHTYQLIEDHPFGGRAHDELRPGIRSIATRSHIVFYRVRNHAIEIVRVLDGRRDLYGIFADDELDRA
jgi:plasmid stabilization system protein ParE